MAHFRPIGRCMKPMASRAQATACCVRNRPARSCKRAHSHSSCWPTEFVQSGCSVMRELPLREAHLRLRPSSRVTPADLEQSAYDQSDLFRCFAEACGKKANGKFIRRLLAFRRNSRCFKYIVFSQEERARAVAEAASKQERSLPYLRQLPVGIAALGREGLNVSQARVVTPVATSSQTAASCSWLLIVDETG